MSGLAQISATERPSAMRPQNLSAHSMLYLVGRPILAGTCVDGVLVLAGIFAQSLLGGATRRCCLPCVVVDLCSIRAQVQYGDEELPRQAARGSAAAGERLADVTRTYNVDPTTIGRLQWLSVQDQGGCYLPASLPPRVPLLPPQPE